MKLLLNLLLFIFFVSSAAFCQPYQYKYYLDKDLSSIDSGAAVFIGKGYRENNSFLLDCFQKKSGIMQMSVHFKDSSLSVLEGSYKSFYSNQQLQQIGRYENNVAQGLWVTHDSIGRITDSVEFDKGNIVRSRNYNYHNNGKVRSYLVLNGSGEQELSLLYDLDGAVVNNRDGEDLLFTKTEVEAEFPGGTNEWRLFLQKNLQIPDPVEYKIPSGQYTVIVRFIVGRDGVVSDIVPETKVGYGFEEEVIRLMKLSEKWKPAMQNGRLVKAIRRQPVSFLIDNGDKK